MENADALHIRLHAQRICVHMHAPRECSRHQSVVQAGAIERMRLTPGEIAAEEAGGFYTEPDWCYASLATG
jgi:hypothetical protein